MTDSRTTAALISVVIPVMDGRFLEEAIGSVLSQDYRPIEIVVIDSSDPEVGSLIAHHGSIVRYEWQAPAGIGAARNRGVELARGELFSFLDSDDLFEPGRLRLQASTLARNPSL